jgi:hypothetical protein
LKGPFSSAFPELWSAASDLQHVRIDDLRAVLHKLSKTASFEVFGTKVEGSSANVVALLVILLVQVYFVVHLIEFRKVLLRIETVPPIAWLGLYPGSWARALFLATQVLPLVIATLLTQRIWSNTEIWQPFVGAGLIFVLAAMAGLAILVFRNRPRLPKEPLLRPECDRELNKGT